MSADYYTRLEQARGPHPSRQVLTSLGRALRLGPDERDYLFRVAGEPAPQDGTISDQARRTLLQILDRVDDLPAQVINARGDILAWNPLSAAVFGDFSVRPAAQRNIPWLFFSEPGVRALFPQEDWPALAAAHVAHLRAAVGRWPNDGRLGRLVRELRRTSPQFESLWIRHEVDVLRSARKTVIHPHVGLLRFDCEVLVGDEHDQRLVLHSTPVGSETYERLELLCVIGIQDLASAPRRA
jgi:PAS domain-containing protein